MRVQRPARKRSEQAEPSAAHAGAAPASRILALQRAAGNHATAGMLQRAFRRNEDELGALTYEDESAEGTQETLEALISAVLKEAPRLKDKEAEIRLKLADFDDDGPPDLAYNSTESVVKWLAAEGIEADEDGSDVDVEDSSEGKTEKEEEPGQTVGKLFFPGDSYHLTVKKAVIKAIGVKKLSFLVYRDKTHHNFNFWFELDGSIFADQNSDRNSKGVDTGYRWTGSKVEKKST